jgi:hypothetical protein
MAQKICSNGHKHTGDKCPYCPGTDPKLRPHKTRLFGTTIRETVDVFKTARKTEKPDKNVWRERKIILCRTAISLAVLVAAVVFVVMEEQRGTGIGLIGTVIGYWLK